MRLESAQSKALSRFASKILFSRRVLRDLEEAANQSWFLKISPSLPESFTLCVIIVVAPIHFVVLVKVGPNYRRFQYALFMVQRKLASVYIRLFLSKHHQINIQKKTLNTPMQLYNDGSACISEINRTSTALTRVGGNCPICSESSLVRSSREASDSAASSFFTSAFVRCVTSDRDIFFSITFLKIEIPEQCKN